jgi:mycofactocin precursor peptide peptidase
MSRLTVVPLGSYEQHGPHLPSDTDTRIVTAVVDRACAHRTDVDVAPVLAYGASDEHLGFDGTLSLGTHALRDALVGIARSATKPVLFANGHGGNHEAISEALDVLPTNCAVWHAAVEGGDAHAGRTETSLMLAIAPEAVRIDLAEAGDTTPIAELMPALREHGVRALSPNGVLGDPAGASAAEGERLLISLATSLQTTIENLLEG